ncbi:MAG: methylmalonyl-CoA epimerase [Holophagaceae bacterium]|jgi:methylmalonyl-CoA/ethylmalonyl-CoA epimerase
MKFLRINHIGIASKDLREVVTRMNSLFDQTPTHQEEVKDQKVNTVFYSAGESRLEFLETTDPEGPIGKFINKRGQGIHHICLEVENIHEALIHLKNKGVRLIDEQPRKGAHNCWVAFIHPSETGGVLMELSQEA